MKLGGWRGQTAVLAAVPLLVVAVGIGLSVARSHTNLRPAAVPHGTASAAPTASAVPAPTERPPIPGPSARFGMAMAFDGSIGETVLFGGQTSDGRYLGDTWSWNGSHWTRLSPTVSPPPRVDGALVWDEAHGLALLYGGIGTVSTNSIGALSDLWSWNGRTWTQLHPAHQPPARVGENLAYDGSSKAVVLFGGESDTRAPIAMNDTWTWDGRDWAERYPTNAPSPRSQAVMAFDRASSALILFGGTNGVPLSDTWAWTGQTWRQLSPSMSPPTRYGASAVYDASRQQLVLFGGEGGKVDQGPLHALADTWVWDGSTWNERSQGFGPSARWLAGISYDQVNRFVVLFGGPPEAKTDSAWGDTWLWDGSEWKLPVN